MGTVRKAEILSFWFSSFPLIPTGTVERFPGGHNSFRAASELAFESCESRQIGTGIYSLVLRAKRLGGKILLLS